MNKSSLTENNKLLLTSFDVWSNNTEASFDYSDGDAGEEYLREVLQSAKDLSSNSLELEKAIFDWVSEYHLSGDRANVYRFLNLNGVKRGLELGAGCGAITRYLGEQNITLDAIEGNIRRAEIARLRCVDQDHVQVIHSNFNVLDLPKSSYDAVFLNGVLEYASKFLPGYSDRDALIEILSRSCATLRSDGIVCIAIENRMGLKYWLGSNEDHYGQPYAGLYGYPAAKGIKTYDANEWESILDTLPGQMHHRFIYPFPDYKMAHAILSDNFLKNQPHAHSNLYRIFSADNGTSLDTPLNEFLLWESLHKSGQFKEFANSFFIVLSADQQRLDEVCPVDFMHISGRGRKPEYRTITQKQIGQSAVRKTPIHVDVKTTPSVLQHNLADATYVTGPLLVSRWIHAALDDDPAVFEKCILDYWEYLLQYWEDNKDVSDCVDLLPFNIIVAEDGTYQPIDKEWRTSESVEPEFVFFRALLWFPLSNETVLNGVIGNNGLATLFDFVEYGFRLVSLTLQHKLDDFIVKEEAFQRQIVNQVRKHPVQAMLVEPLSRRTFSSSSDAFPAQLYWAEGDEGWSEDKSVLVSAREGSDSQTLIFNLPLHGKEISRLRLDPCDRSGFFRIRSVSVVGRDSSGEEILLFELKGGAELVKFADLADILYCYNGLGETFFAMGHDPSFSFELATIFQNASRQKIERVLVEMDWPKSSDYLIAMEKAGNVLLQKKEKIAVQGKNIQELEEMSQTQSERISQQAVEFKEKSDQVKAKDIHIAQLEETVRLMEGTRLWRAAEWVRKHIYYRLLAAKTLCQKSIKTIRNDGFKHFYRKARRAMATNSNVVTLGFLKSDYDLWVKSHQLTNYDIDEIRSNIEKFSYKPLISIIVPVYNVDQKWLEMAIDSIRNQLYENWELCLCDDCSPSPHVRVVLERYAQMDKRIKISLKTVNEGIALTSNAALALATGDYVGLLDHDDELSIDALYENVKVINEHPEVGLIYSDEDKLEMQGNRVDPFFKPDFSPELIRSQNYICHFTVIRKKIVDEVGGFSEGFDGSQDHDLILRATEKADLVYHIPKILYHWRKIPGSTAAVYDSKSYAWEAGRMAIEESLKRTGIKGKVTFAKYQGSYRVIKDIQDDPLVSILIPFKDRPELLVTCVESIIAKSTYRNFEIIGIDNKSEEQKTADSLNRLRTLDKRISFVQYNEPFNFAAICNYGVTQAHGEYILLLNNDMEVISPDWIESLLEHAQQPEVGAVGGKLYYSDDTIQHAGVVIGMTGVAGHPHRLFHRDDVGYYARAHIIQNVSAVTGACLMIKKALYEEVGGLDSEKFAIAYNDIDLCMSLLKHGYRNVFTPYCELYHYESQSRGYEDTAEKLERLQKETDAFNAKWGGYFENGDPCYNPNLSLKNENFTINIGE